MDTGKKDIPELSAIKQKQSPEALRGRIIETNFETVKVQSNEFGAGVDCVMQYGMRITPNRNDGVIDHLHIVRPDYRIEDVASLIEIPTVERKNEEYDLAAKAMERLYWKGALTYGVTSLETATPYVEDKMFLCSYTIVDHIDDHARCQAIHVPSTQMTTNLGPWITPTQPAGSYIVQFQDETVNRDLFGDYEQHERTVDQAFVRDQTIEALKEQIRKQRSSSPGRDRGMKM